MNHEDVDTSYVIAIWLCSTKLLVYIFIQIFQNHHRSIALL